MNILQKITSNKEKLKKLLNYFPYTNEYYDITTIDGTTLNRVAVIASELDDLRHELEMIIHDLGDDYKNDFKMMKLKD